MLNKNLPFSLLLLLLLFGNNLIAQSNDYKAAVGIRASSEFAISGKVFVNDDAAIELIANINSAEFQPNTFTATYQAHQAMSSVLPGLRFYFGGGASLQSGEDISIFGIAGIVGIDYKSDKLPINVSFDIIPVLSFPEDNTTLTSNLGGISIRYTF